MNTGLGNCIIMCGMVYSYARHRGVDIKLMNNGDDCMVFMESENLQSFSDGLEQWFLELGFRMVAEAPVYDISAIEFCQMRYIRTGNGEIMVRNIPTAIRKDALSIIPLTTQRVARQWLGAVGECGLALCAGVPVMQEFYRMYHRMGVKSKIRESVAFKTGIHMLMDGLTADTDEVTEEARYCVWEAWDLLPDVQICLEETYRSMSIDVESIAIPDIECAAALPGLDF
jgi:hypothetical protein